MIGGILVFVVSLVVGFVVGCYSTCVSIFNKLQDKYPEASEYYYSKLDE